MIILALIGGDSCGKTTTLNIVYEIIIKEEGVSKLKITEGNPINKDFSDIVCYKSKNVAFFSMGDYSNITTRIIKEYDTHNVDFLILASNIKFKKPIKLIARFENQLIEKTIVIDKDKYLDANIFDAEVILRIFKKTFKF
jgi:hypothetical protein